MLTKKNYILAVLLSISIMYSCTKEYSTEAVQSNAVTFPTCKQIPFLSGRTWLIDTIVINPPATYNQLSNEDRQSYLGALAWFRKGGTMAWNNDCTVTTSGDWDFGYDKWAVTDNNRHIKIRFAYSGNIDSLLNFTADSTIFTFQRKFERYTLTYILKK